MRRWCAVLALFIVVTLGLSGCISGKDSEAALPAENSGASSETASDTSEENVSVSETETPEIPEPNEGDEQPEGAVPEEKGSDYIEQLVVEAVEKFIQPGMGEYEMAKAAFDYMIETTTLTDPLSFDLWQIRADYSQPPSYVETRALSVLEYNIGKCEDYAAAFTLLLQGLGLEAEYVPGLTYSAQGTGLIDHAWTIAKIDGVWYHLDCQLEANISRHNTIRYKYFMKGDAFFSSSHRWGQNLINAGLLSQEANAEITENYLGHPCPQDYPNPPAPQTYTPAPEPDLDAIQAEIDAEFEAYEQLHGPLELMESNTIPPVFGLEGYGPPDE